MSLVKKKKTIQKTSNSEVDKMTSQIDELQSITDYSSNLQESLKIEESQQMRLLAQKNFILENKKEKHRYLKESLTEAQSAIKQKVIELKEVESNLIDIEYKTKEIEFKIENINGESDSLSGEYNRIIERLAESRDLLLTNKNMLMKEESRRLETLSCIKQEEKKSTMLITDLSHTMMQLETLKIENKEKANLLSTLHNQNIQENEACEIIKQELKKEYELLTQMSIDVKTLQDEKISYKSEANRYVKLNEESKNKRLSLVETINKIEKETLDIKNKIEINKKQDLKNREVIKVLSNDISTNIKRVKSLNDGHALVLSANQFSEDKIKHLSLINTRVKNNSVRIKDLVDEEANREKSLSHKLDILLEQKEEYIKEECEVLVKLNEAKAENVILQERIERVSKCTYATKTLIDGHNKELANYSKSLQNGESKSTELTEKYMSLSVQSHELENEIEKIVDLIKTNSKINIGLQEKLNEEQSSKLVLTKEVENEKLELIEVEKETSSLERKHESLKEEISTLNFDLELAEEASKEARLINESLSQELNLSEREVVRRKQRVISAVASNQEVLDNNLLIKNQIEQNSKQLQELIELEESLKAQYSKSLSEKAQNVERLKESKYNTMKYMVESRFADLGQYCSHRNIDEESIQYLADHNDILDELEVFVMEVAEKATFSNDINISKIKNQIQIELLGVFESEEVVESKFQKILEKAKKSSPNIFDKMSITFHGENISMSLSISTVIMENTAPL